MSSPDRAAGDRALRALAQASAWRVRLTEAEIETNDAFEAWLAEDAVHAAAWARIQGAWDLFAPRQAAAPELIVARRTALGRARKLGRDRYRRDGAGRRLAASVAATVVLGGLGLAGWFAWPHGQVFKTGLGERRMVTLSDNSRISLDSGAEVRVNYSTRSRAVTLVKGQARFDVAHDVERPFSVSAGTEKVIATGTAFNVDMLGDVIRVTLIEGHVVVVNEASPRTTATRPERRTSSAQAAEPRLVDLVSGQQLTAVAAQPTRVAFVSLERAVAWQNGQLIFDDEPLASVAARVSRYASHPVVITDPATASMRISGIFNTGDVNAFVQAVTLYFPVTATPQDDGSVVLTKRG